MPLAAGTRLGPYEIVAPAGSGGMGEVYKGRDTRLDRTVAIKILPAGVADDPLRRGSLCPRAPAPLAPAAPAHLHAARQRRARRRRVPGDGVSRRRDAGSPPAARRASP